MEDSSVRWALVTAIAPVTWGASYVVAVLGDALTERGLTPQDG